MRIDSTLARIAAALIAVTAAAGLVVQFAALNAGNSAADALWIMLRYFTILTNASVAVIMAGVALRPASFLAPRLLGSLTLAIVLVGVIYSLLLRGLLELSAGAKVANFLLHDVVPVLVPLFWLVFVAKGKLRPSDPFLWALYPVGYLGYALLRGAIEDKYAYPFIDVGQHGWTQTLMTSAVIGVGFILCGLALVGLDHWLARRADPTDRSAAASDPRSLP